MTSFPVCELISEWILVVHACSDNFIVEEIRGRLGNGMFWVSCLIGGIMQRTSVFLREELV